MTEANLLAASGRAAPLASQTATLPLLLHGGRPGLIVLARKPGYDGRALAQRFYPIARLISELPGRGASGDWYVSANSFRRRCRKMQHLAGLRACFLDLDFYNVSRWSGSAPADIWMAVQEELGKARLPLPQAVIFTGRGLQLVWSLGHLPVAALPR